MKESDPPGKRQIDLKNRETIVVLFNVSESSESPAEDRIDDDINFFKTFCRRIKIVFLLWIWRRDQNLKESRKRWAGCEGQHRWNEPA